jgi:hypothetical protein
MNRYRPLLLGLLSLSFAACGNGAPTSPSPSVDQIPFSTGPHVIGVLSTYYGVPAAKPPVGGRTGAPAADYLEVDREALAATEARIRGHYLIWIGSREVRRGTLDTMFRLEGGLWRYAGSTVTEGPVQTVPLTVRVNDAESARPVDDVEVIARRKGNVELSSRAVRTDASGEARLEVLKGVFEVEALSEGFEAVVAEVRVEAPAVREFTVRKYGKPQPVKP